MQLYYKMFIYFSHSIIHSITTISSTNRVTLAIHHNAMQSIELLFDQFQSFFLVHEFLTH